VVEPVDNIVALRQQGLSHRQIAERTGVPQVQVWRHLNKAIAAGLLPPPKPKPDITVICRLRAEGLLLREIADQLDLKTNHVSMLLRRHPVVWLSGTGMLTAAATTKTKPKRDLDAEIVELHRRAYPQTSISRVLNISQTTVSRRLRRAVDLGVIPLPEPEPEPVADVSKPFALVTWRGDLSMAPVQWCETEDEAMEAKARVGEPSTVIDIRGKPSRRRQECPTVEEILRSGRGVMEHPWPTYRGRTTL
jgi:transposase-like protein